MLLGTFCDGNPLERIVAKPLNCHSHANSRDTGFWEMLGTTQGPKHNRVTTALF